MKKIIAAILCFVLMASPVWSADYYAQKAGNINADDVWFDAPTGGSGVTGATALDGTHTLYSNSFAITVNISFTAAKITNAAGAGTAGGSFNVATSTSPLTITAAIEQGATADDCLTISGSANANPALTVVASTVVGGGTANGHAISDTHTVGTVVVNTSGGISGGSNASAYGYSYSAGSGNVIINGNVTGATGIGLSTASAGATVNGDCTGGAGGVGCFATSTGPITVTGSILNVSARMGVSGTIIWAPSDAKKYIRFVTTGGGTNYLYASDGLGSDAGGTQVSAANTAAEVKTTAFFVKKDDAVYTQGTAEAGGGGMQAWAY